VKFFYCQVEELSTSALCLHTECQARNAEAIVERCGNYRRKPVQIDVDFLIARVGCYAALDILREVDYWRDNPILRLKDETMVVIALRTPVKKGDNNGS
jgi:hypothetical protein